MKSFFVSSAMLILTVPAFASPSAGRSLPRGEETPSVIEALYAAPAGEVQFVRMGGEGYTALYRNTKGNLIGLREIRGPGLCDEWLTSDKGEAMPRGCEFVFRDEFDGALTVVHAEELQEASLFQAVKGKMRGVDVAL